MATNEVLMSRIQRGFTKTVEYIKDVKKIIGDLNSLSTTDRSTVVAAINEIKTLIDSKTKINDGTSNSNETWSSNKISTAISAAVTALINSAGTDEDTLKELADKIVALAQADQGLVSTTGVQSFTDTQKTQARTNIDAVDISVIGDVLNTDFVAIIDTAYNAPE